jgi:predicted DNA-binding transcriptional regulator AlpA
MPENIWFRPQDDELLTSSEAAKALGVSASFLAKARVGGTGPRYVKLGRAVRYRPYDLEQYIRARSRSSTSER